MKKFKNVMLTVTEKCNLNCLYCFEHNKSHKSMSYETAIDIIEKEMAEENDYEGILFDFMGGEPFVEFDVIRKICEFTWSREWNKEYLFFASTNGTLIHENVKEWLEKNKDRFVCGISLDGLPEVHNYNRSNSFEKIDTAFFLDLWPLQEAKMTIYPDNIDKMSEGIIYLHSLGFRVKSNLAYGPDWYGMDKLKAYTRGLKELGEYYLLNLDIEPSTIINMDVVPVAYPKEKIHKWCGMGGQMVAYDINGKKYPCHFFQDMSSTDINYREIQETEFSSIQNTLSDKCKKCILRNSCATCYGYNYSRSGDFGNKDNGLCEYKKTSAIATSTLLFKKMYMKHNGILDNLDFDEKQKLKAIRIIQESARSNIWEIQQ